MGKFNADKIKQRMEAGAERIAPGDNRLEAGAGLLNSASKLQKAREMKAIYVLPDQIDFSEENKGISISALEGLAESIADVGLINPIVLRQKEDGRYKIVAGERRFRAIRINIENGKWEPDRPIKSSEFDPDLIDLPLSDDEKEEYVRITENAEQRDKTDGDRMRQMKQLKMLYEKMREKGELSGVKTRTLLAQDMKMGESSVAQFQTVENKGSEDLINAVLDNQMNIGTAVGIAKLPKEEQTELIEKARNEKTDGEQITRQDILKAEHERKHKVETAKEISDPSTAETEQEDGTRITTKMFRKDIAVITKKLKTDEAGVLLDEDAYMSYLKHIRAIEKLFV